MKKPWNYHLSTNWQDEKQRGINDLRREKIGTIVGLVCIILLAALLLPAIT